MKPPVKKIKCALGIKDFCPHTKEARAVIVSPFARQLAIPEKFCEECKKESMSKVSKTYEKWIV